MELVRLLKKVLPPLPRQMLRGLQTYLPGASRAWSGTGGTDSAAYCYEVFLKHLSLCAEAGMTAVPRSVAEIGPGDSIGIGLAALVAGSDRYAGLDVVPYSLSARNLAIFRTLVAYFQQRKPNPSWGWPNYDHAMDSDFFPGRILTDAALAQSLAPARLQRIEAALQAAESGPIRIAYHCPWTAAAAVEPSSVDWIYSQSVMEHVDDVEEAYACMHRWLRPGGYLSHQIDLTCHELWPEWNGHWGVSGRQWRIVRGRRVYLINRLPYSAHSRALHRLFDVRTELRLEMDGGLSDDRLRAPFDALDRRERRTACYFVVAVKR